MESYVIAARNEQFLNIDLEISAKTLCLTLVAVKCIANGADMSAEAAERARQVKWREKTMHMQTHNDIMVLFILLPLPLKAIRSRIRTSTIEGGGGKKNITKMNTNHETKSASEDICKECICS